MRLFNLSLFSLVLGKNIYIVQVVNECFRFEFKIQVSREDTIWNTFYITIMYFDCECNILLLVFLGVLSVFFTFVLDFRPTFFFNSNITVKTGIVDVWICCNIIVTANVKFYSTNADRLFSTIQEILYLVIYIYLCQNIFFFLKKTIEI